MDTATPQSGRQAAQDGRRTPADITPGLRQRLLRLAYRFLWNADDAEDAVQDAMAAAHEHSDRLRDASRWWPWLCRIVVTRCHEQGRKRVRSARMMDRLTNDALAASSDQSSAPLSEAAVLLKEALKELPSRQRDVLVLLHLEQMSYEQIAEVLHIAASTARVHAKDGRESLRELMSGRHPELFERPIRSQKEMT